MILLLGGTAEGRQVAEALHTDGRAFVLSLAGRTADPLTIGEVRTGGFGGVDGLVDYLRANTVSLVVDATHPFAATMTNNAAKACAAAGVPLLRLDRPGWADAPGATGWHWVDDHEAAARVVADLSPRTTLLTVGRLHTLDYAAALGDRRVVARVAEPPVGSLPQRWELVLARGPFDVAGERELFAAHGVDCVVTKDSGGAHTAAKLQVAAEVGADVVVVRRTGAPSDVTVVTSVAEALERIRRA